MASTRVDNITDSPPSLSSRADVSTRLDSYHSYTHPTSPTPLSPSRGFALIARSAPASSHRSHPAHFSYVLAPPPSSSSATSTSSSAQSAAQVKVARLQSIKQASGFKRVKRDLVQASKEDVLRRSATTGEVEKRAKQLWVRSEPEDLSGGEEEEEEAEGDETDGDWSWMEGHAEHENEGEEEEDEGILSSAARMEIRMKRSLPLFHREQ